MADFDTTNAEDEARAARARQAKALGKQAAALQHELIKAQVLATEIAEALAATRSGLTWHPVSENPPAPGLYPIWHISPDVPDNEKLMIARWNGHHWGILHGLISHWADRPAGPDGQ